MSILLAIMLAGASSVGVEFQLLDTGKPFRSIERTSLLYGTVEFRIRTPDGTAVRGLQILTDSVTTRGDDVTLCGNPGGDSSCVVEFSHIARRKLRVEYDLIKPGDGRRRISESIATLHAHLGREAGSGSVMIEHARTEGTPPDYVTRTIRFESSTGGGDRRRVQYHTDIEKGDLDVKVRGVRGTTVVSLSPPDPEAPKLIPILFDVAPYLRTKKRRGGIEWEDSYTTRVMELRQGLRQAAAAGVDVEYLVVSYGANDRLFGPFRLRSGRLDDAGRLANDATLDALESALLRPPDPEFPGSDFGSIVHTLNDLYLRGHAGQVQLVWITDGWSAGGLPRFQPDLWPERVAQLNPEWSEDEQAEVLAILDTGLGLQDAELSRFIATMPADETDRAGRILRFLQALDRDATRTLDPHRVDTSPMMNCLFIPSDRSLRGDRFTEFLGFVEQRWGGDLFRLLRLNQSITEELEEELNQRGRGSGPESLAGLLRLTYEQMIHSGRLVLEVPNPKQNGARREITVNVRRDGIRVRLMPTYSASRPRDERLAEFVGSPFKSLRMLAAYDSRYHPFDGALREATRRRWEIETDPQVRAVVFESWISVQLQLLQTGEDRLQAYDALVSAGREAGRLPLPTLARDAAAAAEWFWSRRPGGVPIRDTP